MGAKTTCTETCGDGKNLHTKTCDDGNTKAGDGCDATCNVETYWTCNGGTVSTADVCHPICGDSKKIGNELCDDGNNNHFDGYFIFGIIYIVVHLIVALKLVSPAQLLLFQMCVQKYVEIAKIWDLMFVMMETLLLMMGKAFKLFKFK